MMMLALVLLLLVLAAATTTTVVHATILCSTPLSTFELESTSTFSLSDGEYGTSVVAAGPYVMVLFKDAAGGLHSQFSFNHGVDFPQWTRKPLPLAANTQVDLVTDQLRILAVGAVEGEMRSLEFSLGQFVWDNSTEAVIGTPAKLMDHLSCAARQGLVVCVVTTTPVLEDGYSVYRYATTTAIGPKQWDKTPAEHAPLTTMRVAIASDGASFMLCAIGSITRRLVCSYTVDGIEPVELCLGQPFDGQFNDGIFEVQLTSAGAPGAYVVVFQDGPVDTATAVTRDYGKTWMHPNNIGFNDQVPQFLIHTDRVVAFQHPEVGGDAALGPQIALTFQNNTLPFGWGEPLPFSNGTTASFSVASAHFQDNYHTFHKEHADGRLVVQSCIPTSLPTVQPSPSPTSSSALDVRGGALVVVVLVLVYNVVMA